jgi:hypothetical protein
MRHFIGVVVGVGLCAVALSVPAHADPENDGKCDVVLAHVPLCSTNICYTEFQCAPDSGLSVVNCKECLASLHDQNAIHSCLPAVYGFCRLE